MNKKQILKEQKRLKEERKQAERLFQDDKEVYKVFKIALGVILFIGVVYVAINIFNGNWNILIKKNETTTEIDQQMLLVGTMFNREKDEYLVLAYDMNKESDTFYSALVSNYEEESPKLYLVNLGSGFNKDFIGEKTVVSNDLSKLKFGGATLLQIKGDKIIKSYTTEKDITNYFISKK